MMSEVEQISAETKNWTFTLDAALAQLWKYTYASKSNMMWVYVFTKNNII